MYITRIYIFIRLAYLLFWQHPSVAGFRGDDTLLTSTHVYLHVTHTHICHGLYIYISAIFKFICHTYECASRTLDLYVTHMYIHMPYI